MLAQIEMFYFLIIGINIWIRGLGSCSILEWVLFQTLFHFIYGFLFVSKNLLYFL